jgi:hypothetical protein
MPGSTRLAIWDAESTSFDVDVAFDPEDDP